MQDTQSSSSSSCELNKPLIENTNFMNLNEMMGLRENEMLQEMDKLTSFYSPYRTDEKIKDIYKKQLRKIREKYVDVIKYNLYLDLFDKDFVMNDEISPIMFKRKFLANKRVLDKDGEPLHIYKNKNGKYMFIDEEFIDNIGIGLREMKFFAENSKDFVNEPNFANSPLSLGISEKHITIPRTFENYVENDTDAFWANLNTIFSYVGSFLAKNKKLQTTVNV